MRKSVALEREDYMIIYRGGDPCFDKCVVLGGEQVGRCVRTETQCEKIIQEDLARRRAE